MSFNMSPTVHAEPDTQHGHTGCSREDGPRIQLSPGAWTSAIPSSVTTSSQLHRVQNLERPQSDQRLTSLTTIPRHSAISTGFLSNRGLSIKWLSSYIALSSVWHQPTAETSCAIQIIKMTALYRRQHLGCVSF